jgi:LysM repeat protein
MGGGARFNTINRPRRSSIVQWDGDDPYQMDLSIMLDGWKINASVEADVARINQMRFSSGTLVPPVQVYVDGALPVKGATWIIMGIDWGSRTIWDSDTRGTGHRLRQDAVLHLLQYVQETDLKLNKMPAMTTRYMVHEGETLQMIAANKGVTVSAIKVANGLRDGKTIKKGQVLYIPPSLYQGQN